MLVILNLYPSISHVSDREKKRNRVSCEKLPKETFFEMFGNE